MQLARTLVARAFHRSRGWLERGLSLQKWLFEGLWLGLLGRPGYHRVDETYYAGTARYLDPQYNRMGLFPFEIQAVERYFAGCGRLVVAAAGGGREVLALARRGFEVEAFECHPKLVETANRLLGEEGLVATVRVAPRDRCPDLEGPFDGAVVGWGAYMHIQGRGRRVELLRQLRAALVPGGPILLSFFHRRPGSRRFRVIAAVANLVRWLTLRRSVEEGDRMDVTFVHHLTEEEVRAELDVSSFDLVHFSTQGYAHAVGRAR